MSENGAFNSTKVIGIASYVQPLTGIESDQDGDSSDSSLPRRIGVKPRPSESEELEFESHSNLSAVESPTRLVVVSWKIRQFSLLCKASKPGVRVMQYNSESTLESIMKEIDQLLNGSRLSSIAFVCHGYPGMLTVCHDQVNSCSCKF